MSLTDQEKLKIAVEAHYQLHKRKGKSHTFTTYKNGGVNRATIYRWLPGIRYVLSKYQNEHQSFIVKMMEGLLQKLMKAHSEGLTIVL